MLRAHSTSAILTPSRVFHSQIQDVMHRLL